MCDAYQISIPGQPIAWARARMSARGAHFTPARVRTWQGVARTAASSVMGERNLLDGPLALEVAFVFDVPTSWPQWKKEAALGGLIVPAGKPDLDNLVKNVKDAFTKIVWHDDTQVVVVHATKVYGAQPRTEARVSHTETHAAQNVRKADVA